MSRGLVTRRSALRILGAGAGSVAVLPWLSEEGVAAFAEIQRTKAAPSLKVLSASQYATLAALTEAIIPADERSPGAKEARVADYVDLILSEGDDKLRQEWLDGLAALDADAVTRFGAPFVGLDAPQVEAMLTEVSRSTGRWSGPTPPRAGSACRPTTVRSRWPSTTSSTGPTPTIPSWPGTRR